MAHTPLNIAFIWHLHQPYYKSTSGIYKMPWVRFHATKNYLDMLLLAEQFPDIRQSFNLVPSLAQQIMDYAERGARDMVWELSMVPASELSEAHKSQILQSFFLVNEIHLKQEYGRYRELWQKLDVLPAQASVRTRMAVFSEAEWRDLQVSYNLSWMGPLCQERPVIRALMDKGRNYSEADKAQLFDEIRNLMGEIIPRMRSLWQSDQIELLTAPFYHPILPLLIDSNIANVAAPEIELPQPPYRHPEDARAQLRKGLDFIRAHLGRKPAGILPPEGALSMEAIKLLANMNVQWIATDERLYHKSTHANQPRHRMFQLHRVRTGRRNLPVFFRDKQLSNAISFVYGNWDPETAAADFIQRLHQIRSETMMLVGESRLPHHLVNIICDGENSWEMYPDSGRRFLKALFGMLSEDPLLKTCTVSAFLSRMPEANDLEQLYPGSRMADDFSIWIADEEDHMAWRMLKQTRDFLEERERKGVLSDETLAAAWEQIYIAQGSDWCWWYGHEHSSMQDSEFDQLFREHLMKVYELAGADAPAELYQAIKRVRLNRSAALQALRPITPDIDGNALDENEWSGAAVYEVNHINHSGHALSERVIKKLFVGYDADHLYFRIDFLGTPDPFYEILLMLKFPRNIQLIISPLRGVVNKIEPRTMVTNREVLPPRFRVQEVFEAGFKKSDLGITGPAKLGFQIQIHQYGNLVEVYPQNQMIELELPG